MGPPRRKRPRTMSQQSLTHMLRLRKTSPPPPGTPCKQHWLRAAPHSPYLGAHTNAHALPNFTLLDENLPTLWLVPVNQDRY